MLFRSDRKGRDSCVFFDRADLWPLLGLKITDASSEVRSKTETRLVLKAGNATGIVDIVHRPAWNDCTFSCEIRIDKPEGPCVQSTTLGSRGTGLYYPPLPRRPPDSTSARSHIPKHDFPPEDAAPVTLDF